MNKQLKMMVWTASVMLVLSMVFASCKDNKSKSKADDDDEDETELAEDRSHDDEDDVTTIDVTTARELILALQNDVHINVIVNDVLRMTDAIDELVDEGKLKRYPEENNDHLRPGVYWAPEYDGNTLFIVGLNNITIEATHEDQGFLLATPRYADVLHFEKCKDIVIKNFTLGHEETGDCVGDVLVFNGSENIVVEDCHLFGCGVNGLSASGTSNIVVKNTEIYGCSDRGVDLYRSENVCFDHCKIFNNGCGMYVDPYCSDILFAHCTLKDIKGQMFICYAPVSIRNSKIEHHHDDMSENVDFANCDVVMDYSEAEEYPDIEDWGE
ncbi:MAG: right-handed parallel beta-helix repeat-containing protein [Prevotella sp.]|nr:right-handed parallel beta-helix repeat-containing protein [Prevotella sp.]